LILMLIGKVTTEPDKSDICQCCLLQECNITVISGSVLTMTRHCRLMYKVTAEVYRTDMDLNLF
jgi:hypothetical protein